MILFLVAQLTIAAPILPRDTAGHLDLRVGRTVQLTASQSSTWSSGNPTVASVSVKGVVTAKARGYATITATAGTVKATVRACVTVVDQEAIPWKIVSTATAFRRPDGTEVPTRKINPKTVTQTVAHIQLVTVPDWGSCVHWTMDTGSSHFARIDRKGMLHTPQSVLDVKAYIGPRLP